jgi:hypothetical protein
MRSNEEALRRQDEAVLKQVFEQNVALCRQIGELEAAPPGGDASGGQARQDP